MSRVAVNPVATPTVVPGPTGGRGGDDESARFEVAIRSRLDLGRSAHPRTRVAPSDPRDRSLDGAPAQRHTPEPKVDAPVAGQDAGAGARHAAETVAATGAPGVHGAPGAPSGPSAGQEQDTSPTAAAASGSVAGPGAPTSATTATTAAEPASTAGQGATTGAAGAAGQTSTDGPATKVTTDAPSTGLPVAGQPGAGDSQGGSTGSGSTGSGPGTPDGNTDAGRSGSAQTGAGQPEVPVPSLVHGRPPALGGASTNRADAAADAVSTSVAGGSATGVVDQSAAPAAAVGQGTAITATAVPVVAGTVTDATDAVVAPAAPTTGATTAAPVAAPPAANPVVPLPPQAQVLSAVSPLLTGPDGTHRVTVTLEPENLGKVRIQLSLSGGEVALHLVAADAATREMLRQSLPELRTQLEQSGLRTAGMDVQSGSAGLFGREAGAGAGNATGHGGGPSHRAGHGAVPGLRAGIGDQPTPSSTPRSLSNDVALDVRM